MAKQRRTKSRHPMAAPSTPVIDSCPSYPEIDDPAVEDDTPEKVPRINKEVTVTLRMGPISDAYSQRHVNFNLTQEQACTLRRIRDEMCHYGMTTSGRPIRSTSDALRCLIDQFHTK